GGVVDLVDLIGGVDFYVPQDMKWDMSDTGDITINLKEGQQVLDGSKALQLLRFRRYPEGDVARVRVQQSFLMAVAQKLLGETNLVTTLPGLMKAAYDYVETDLSLSDALKYVQYASDVKISSLETETLPGVGQMVNGISYYLHDSVETKVSVKKVFFSDDVVTGDVSTESSKDKVIEVANGGGRSGIAGENQEMLISEGYNVEKVSNYNGEKTTYTRIYVRNQGEGEDLRSYYTGSKLMVDEDFIDEGIDILIILGTEE
ncbi:MAG: LCP family protein, partial [Anaerotignaceae bacterium]